MEAEIQTMKKKISVETKKIIIANHEKGARVIDLAIKYGVNKSTISTILKNKEIIKNVKVAKGVARLSTLRNPVIEEMENLLLIWIQQRQLACDTVTMISICEKAKVLYIDLLDKLPGGSTEKGQGFKASRGWFENFKRRNDIHSAVRLEEATCSATKTGAEATASKYHLPLQVLCDESGNWKKLPKRTYITAEDNVDDEADYHRDQDNEQEQEIEIEVEQPKPQEQFSCWEGKVETGVPESVVTPKPEIDSKSVGGRRRKRKSIDRYMVQTAFEVLKKSVDVPDVDECDSFGNFIAKKLKGYSLHTKNYVEHLISDIIYRADRGEFALQS